MLQGSPYNVTRVTTRQITGTHTFDYSSPNKNQIRSIFHLINQLIEYVLPLVKLNRTLKCQATNSATQPPGKGMPRFPLANTDEEEDERERL